MSFEDPSPRSAGRAARKPERPRAQSPSKKRGGAVLLSLASLAFLGCATTVDRPSLPPGHPALAETPAAAVERSRTLAAAEPVDPRPARSEHWARPSEEHAPGHHHPGETAPTHHPAPDPSRATPGHAHAEPSPGNELDPEGFDGQLAQALTAYFAAAEALADDDLEAAIGAVERFESRLGRIDVAELEPADSEHWLEIERALARPMRRFLEAPVIEAARTAFEPISEQVKEAVLAFGGPELGPVYLLHCPMAFGGRGAHWLQPVEEVSNPYYGAVMLRCGAVEETLIEGEGPEPSEQPGGAHHHHEHHGP